MRRGITVGGSKYEGRISESKCEANNNWAGVTTAYMRDENRKE